MTTLVERLNRWRFRRLIPGILKTPPMHCGDRPFTVLSQVHQRDVLPYLLAVKTFMHYAKPARVVLVADPTLDAASRDLLRQHLPGLRIVEARDYQRPALPIGGTWERLSAISVLNADSSIVQLDADTVTLGVPAEVVDWAGAGKSFVIRSEGGVEIVSLDVAAAHGRKLLQESRHIQAAAEARMTELPDAARLRYVRGCSGFTGFGRGALTPERLDALAIQMRKIHGPRWDEWGTEQVSSNLLVASADDARLLPHPRYCNADSKEPGTVLAHYIGYARYVSRDYERMARRSLALLGPA